MAAPAPPAKGRGATFNPANRFRQEEREAVAKAHRAASVPVAVMIENRSCNPRCVGWPPEAAIANHVTASHNASIPSRKAAKVNSQGYKP